MRTMIATALGLLMLGTGAASAQTAPGSGANPSVPPAASSDQRVLGNAPVGHRQPRRDPDVANDPFARAPEDIALDRKIRSICRGC